MIDTKYFAFLRDTSGDSHISKWIKSSMYLLLVVTLANFNLCCLLITQCSQNGKLTILNHVKDYVPQEFSCLTLTCDPIYDATPSLFLLNSLLQLMHLLFAMYLTKAL